MSKKKIKNKMTLNQQEKIIYKSNEPIFKFIDPNANDKLSKMKGFDLQELLIFLDKYYLEFRKKMGFDNYITFGLEIEFENANGEQINSKLSQEFPTGTWETKPDCTLHGGYEIESPIARDNYNYWSELKTVCQIVRPNASISSHSGGHIHIGTQVLGDKSESWLNFLKLWSVYENIIYRFAYGEFLTARSSLLRFAPPTSERFWIDYESLKCDGSSTEAIIKKISKTRDQSVNFSNVSDCSKFKERNTIEFRCPNGTLEPAIWQNNINLFVHLLICSKGLNFDDDMIQKRKILNNNKYLSLDWYKELYLQQSLELCDIVFTNNFDKIYFLRQYLKSFETGTKELERAKTFTKKIM